MSFDNLGPALRETFLDDLPHGGDTPAGHDVWMAMPGSRRSDPREMAEAVGIGFGVGSAAGIVMAASLEMAQGRAPSAARVLRGALIGGGVVATVGATFVPTTGGDDKRD